MKQTIFQLVHRFVLLSRRSFLLALIVLAVSSSTRGWSQEGEDDELRSGVVGKYSGRVSGTFTQLDFSLTASWDGTSQDHRLVGGPHSVRWSGFLMSQAPGTYQLHALVRGRVRIRLGQQEVLFASHDTLGWASSQPLNLPFDYHPLEIEYTADVTGQAEPVREPRIPPEAADSAPGSNVPPAASTVPDGVQPSQTGSSPDAFRVALFWTGPQFSLEPIGPAFLFHEPSQSPAQDELEATQAGDLVRALRCAACHAIPGEAAPLPAPALDQQAGILQPAWLLNRLLESQPAQAQAVDPTLGTVASDRADSQRVPPMSKHAQPVDGQRRRMPHYGLNAAEAQAITAFLLHAASNPAAENQVNPQQAGAQDTAINKEPTKQAATKQAPSKQAPSTPQTPAQAEPKQAAAAQAAATQAAATQAKSNRNLNKAGEKSESIDLVAGERLLLTVGCLACHEYQGLGTSGLFAGGDLTHIGAKRPAHFFASWLENPQHFNRDARMPIFELTGQERRNLAAILAQLGAANESAPAANQQSNQPNQLAPGKNDNASAEHGEQSASPPAQPDRPDGKKEAADALAKQIKTGAQLVVQYRCVACHRMPQMLAAEAQAGFQPAGNRSANDVTRLVEVASDTSNRSHATKATKATKTKNQSSVTNASKESASKENASKENALPNSSSDDSFVACEVQQAKDLHQPAAVDTQHSTTAKSDHARRSQPIARSVLMRAMNDSVGCFGAADAAQHRPGYLLGEKQRVALVRYLLAASAGDAAAAKDRDKAQDQAQEKDQRKHEDEAKGQADQSPLKEGSSEGQNRTRAKADQTEASDTRSSVEAAKPNQPGTDGDQEQQPMLVADSAAERAVAIQPLVVGRRELLEQNCLACHARAGGVGLAEVAAKVVAAHGELSAELPGMTPPALDSVGDKLLDDALQAAILRRDPPRRPYLAVRMPRFSLAEHELQALTHYFVMQDRVPEFPGDRAAKSAALGAASNAGSNTVPSLVRGAIPRAEQGARPEALQSGTRDLPRPAEQVANPATSTSPSVTRPATVLKTERTVPTPSEPVKKPAAAQSVPNSQSTASVAGNVVAPVVHDAATALALKVAGSRLVTTDGFGCTSCHGIADVEPVKAPLNARGPNLSLLGKRIRRSWFDRFVANPARLVPRMEMPSVRIPVRGLLDDDLARQIFAVWEVLNQEGFRPPLPDPVRVVRRSGSASAGETPVVITDVVRDHGQILIKPLLVGLPNRHNLLFDLAKARLAEWSIGDLARQRTEGKTWYWETAGTPLWQVRGEEPELRVHAGEQTWVPQLQGQFMTEFDTIVSSGDQFRFTYRLQLTPQREPLYVEQSFQPLAFPDQTSEATGFRRQLTIRGLQPGEQLQLRLPTAAEASVSTADTEPARTTSPHEFTWDANTRVRVVEPTRVEQVEGRWWTFTAADGPLRIQLEYRSSIPVDHFPPLDNPAPLPEVERLAVVPGFESLRLPLPEEVMPTALAWRPNGDLVVASLKGQIWLGRDQDGDGREETWRAFSDELAAPYGLAAEGSQIDVVNKYAVLRLTDEDGDDRADRYETIASGWGHTVDYHDWAVGLPRDGTGGYFVALPCQQDQRSEAAARFRGQIVYLRPRQPDQNDPRRFSLETVSQGHRFPMGLARNRAGELFVTDNQGNFNPFNELNHVVRGKHYGFINSLERRPDYRPPLTPPAIDLPHPWTRSVNGICFLETPNSILAKTGTPCFGPFEGHLIGCEYDTRRLIRMSLQRVGDTMQGACYPFTYEAPTVGSPLLGPLTCEVAPDGDLYVGSIRDSGWGGANNIGELVRMRLEPEQLPCGIAEVRTYRDGLEIELTRPADPVRAADLENYSIASYTRTSTPAYGGSDQQRRVERIESVMVENQGQRIRLRLAEQRANFVYEIRLKNIAANQSEFFPAEAYLTCRQVQP